MLQVVQNEICSATVAALAYLEGQAVLLAELEDLENLQHCTISRSSSSASTIADPLMVTGVFFLLFDIAVVFFCSLSTIFIRYTQDKCYSANAMADSVECSYRWSASPSWFSER